MKTFEIELVNFVSPPYTDTISGREFGEAVARESKLIDHINNNKRIIIVIDSQKIKAINDSFIKGFFSSVFNTLRTKENVNKFFELRADDYYKRLFEKNWTLLEAINNV